MCSPIGNSYPADFNNPDRDLNSIFEEQINLAIALQLSLADVAGHGDENVDPIFYGGEVGGFPLEGSDADTGVTDGDSSDSETDAALDDWRDGSGLEDNADDVNNVAQQGFSLSNNNYLTTNPLSYYWQPINMKENLKELPLVYILGMIGYAAALPLRIFIFAVALIKLITEFVKIACNWQWGTFSARMKVRAIILLGSAGEVCSGIVGLLAPPLAYKLDEFIQGFETVHKWFAHAFKMKLFGKTTTISLSCWYYEEIGQQVGPYDIGFGRNVPLSPSAHLDTNAMRIELKGERTKKEQLYFSKARDGLLKHLSKDALCGEAGEQKIRVLALATALMNGRDLKVFIEEALSMMPVDNTDDWAADEKRTQEKEFLEKTVGQLLQYRKFLLCSWNISHLTKMLLLFVAYDQERAQDSDYFLAGAKGSERLREKLINFFFKPGVVEAYYADRQSELAIKIDAFFGVEESKKELQQSAEEIGQQLSQLKYPTSMQGEDLQDYRKRMRDYMQNRNALVAEKEAVAQKLASLCDNGEKEAEEYFIHNNLLQVIQIEKDEFSLLFLFKNIVHQAKILDSHFFTQDRDLLTAIAPSYQFEEDKNHFNFLVQ